MVLMFVYVPYSIDDYIWANLNFQKLCNTVLSIDWGVFKFGFVGEVSVIQRKR